MSEPSWHDKQYLPSLSVAGVQEIFQSWRAHAADSQKRLKHQADIRYGTHPREVMDFYPAKDARGCVIYIHGGYWVGFSKFETTWVADGFVDQGLSVALINYPLCPEVKIADIRASCTKAFVHLHKNVLGEVERKSIIATGHSAGGHLVAAYMLEDWVAHGLPVNPLKGVMPISGVFDVTPLLQTSLNANLRLDGAQAKALNLIGTRPHNTAKLVLAVGAQESAEFHGQSHSLARSWKSLTPKYVDVPGTNHFTIVDHLAAKSGVLNRLAVQMADS